MRFIHQFLDLILFVNPQLLRSIGIFCGYLLNLYYNLYTFLRPVKSLYKLINKLFRDWAGYYSPGAFTDPQRRPASWFRRSAGA